MCTLDLLDVLARMGGKDPVLRAAKVRPKGVSLGFQNFRVPNARQREPSPEAPAISVMA